MYQKIEQRHIEVLQSIVGTEHVVYQDIHHDYAHDELGSIEMYPEVVVIVSNKHQIQDIMKLANDEIIPVTVRGSGTGLVGACVPIKGGILLDMTKMNQFIELDEVNMTLTVEPGVLLMDIYQYVEKHNLFYAPDPGEKSATIGGNIATNAGGMRAVKYGVTRDWIRGLEVVLPDGNLIELGGKVVKDSSGFSLKHLMIGSEGTLGIIVSATLKLIPKPKYTVSLLIPFETREEAVNGVSSIIQNSTLPTAVEFLEKDSLAFSEEFLGKKIPHNNYNSYLLLSFDGNTQNEVDGLIDTISLYCVEHLNAIDVYLLDTDERKKSVWSARGSFLEAIKSSTTKMDECDVVLPRSNVSEFLTFTDHLSKELNIRVPYFGHAGDGNLHIYFCKDNMSDQKWEETLRIGFQRMYEKAFSLGGLVSGEHGIGKAKKEYLSMQVGVHQMNIMRNIKQIFDKNNILNPDKIV